MGARNLWSRAWRRFWARAPRRLVITAEGKIVLGLALAVGFAAINTGNNLLFLGWGLILSSIVISGLLSESTLRVVSIEVDTQGLGRAGEPLALPLRIINRARRWVAFALEIEAVCGTPHGTVRAPGPFVLRLPANSTLATFSRFVPTRRGLHTLKGTTCRTAYPFGFFRKDRRFEAAPPSRFWVAPPRVDVSGLVPRLTTRYGQASSQHAGPGEEFFALRPYREGDDPRRIHWRRSAKSGRVVAREEEAALARQVLLKVAPPRDADPDTWEPALATAGSLAELLLLRGDAVGMVAPGTFVAPAAGVGQATEILAALARVELSLELPVMAPSRGATLVAVVPAGHAADAGADATVEARP